VKLHMKRFKHWTDEIDELGKNYDYDVHGEFIHAIYGDYSNWKLSRKQADVLCNKMTDYQNKHYEMKLKEMRYIDSVTYSGGEI
jgi:hypothetical protein